MSVYKEIGYLAREIKKQSRQIWKDAADYGVPVKSYDEPIIKQVKQMMEMYQVPVKTERYDGGFTQTFEFDGQWPAILEAGFQKMRITFVSCLNAKPSIGKGYLTVETWNEPEQERIVKNYDY
jgi:hypothetical protein